MITVSDVSLSFGGQMLFKDVNLLFTAGNCYGVIGANGAGKSTFLKILCGALEPTTGTVTVQEGLRMSVLKQDHYAYDEYTVQETVIMGNPRLYEVMKQKDALYAKEDFTEEDGNLASELEGEFAELGGWEAESDASKLVQGLGLDESIMYAQMSSLAGNEKVKVLLAQALFGNPDIILMDEPTNHLDIDAVAWLEDFLAEYFGTEDTILYAACFDANGGVFEPLFTDQDAIISDSLNHASIIDGVRLCKAVRYRYANADMEDLEKQLKLAQAQRFRIIVTDGVFSMDGNVAPMDKITELANKYDALVMVDECHSATASGVVGESLESP